MYSKLLTSFLICGIASAAESFENLPAGKLTRADTAYGTLTAADGMAVVKNQKKLARNGNNALHILGGKDRSVTLTLAEPIDQECAAEFWIQRWTRYGNFHFTCTAVTPQGEHKVAEVGNKLGIGGYNRRVELKLPAGTTALRLTCNSADKGGVLVDDFSLHSGDMIISELEIINPGPFPLLKRAAVNPAFAIKVDANGAKKPLTPETISFTVYPADSLDEVLLRTGTDNGRDFKNSRILGKGTPNKNGVVTIRCTEPISYGTNWLWVDATPSTASSVGGVVEFRNIQAAIGDKQASAEPVRQRIGYMVAVPHEVVGNQPNGADARKCIAFRIPGLITTDKGTLIGVYDARYNHEGDLCADIDVATVRSTDGGQTWTTPSVAMDAGPGANNGCGDPCILQDANGRIWIQSLAAHMSGGAILGVSKNGQGKNRTGQWIMTYSDDDGKTWTKDFVNPTTEIKKDEWTCILAGPGNGITTSKGIIVFPAQIWQQGANPRCRSTICYSDDGGKTWNFGEGLPHSTSECQVVELQDGSLMLNARNENRSGKRIVYVTKDLGKTWKAHETNDRALREPVCQASLINVDNKKHGRMLFFSNPKSGSRDHMTIRVSKDDGKTWSDGYEYDRRGCAGYSCLTQIDANNVGVFYEVAHTLTGTRGIGFLRFPIDTIVTEKTEQAGTPVEHKSERPVKQRSRKSKR